MKINNKKPLFNIFNNIPTSEKDKRNLNTQNPNSKVLGAFCKECRGSGIIFQKFKGFKVCMACYKKKGEEQQHV